MVGRVLLGHLIFSGMVKAGGLVFQLLPKGLISALGLCVLSCITSSGIAELVQNGLLNFSQATEVFVHSFF